MTNKTKIFAVKTDETIHYIGKTITENKEGQILKSDLTYMYLNEKLRKVYEDHQNIVIEQIKVVDDDEWYDEKLQEVIKKYTENHPLVNAQWMLDGKRGIEYWKGKKRDANTLKALSESKYKKICQFDTNGNLTKIWNSAKEAATILFKDYRVVNGSACSKIYTALSNEGLKGSFRKGYYGYRYDDVIKHYGTIQKKIKIENIRAEEKQKRGKKLKNLGSCFKNKYTVVQYDNNDVEINRFDNVDDAAKKLGIGMSSVCKICQGKIKKQKYILKYGEKIKQKIIFK